MNIVVVSNSPETEEEWNGSPPQKEQRCARCYGSGQDRDGADCVHCDGYGTVLV